MIRALGHLWALIVKEFLAILRDPKSRIIIFAPPLIQLIIFANTLTMETQNIKILAVDYSNTLSSRNFISQIKASDWFDEVDVTQDKSLMEELLLQQKIHGAVIIFDDFEAKLKKGEKAQVGLVLDGRVPSVATSLQAYFSQIAQAFTQQYYPKSVSPIEVEWRSWFNPNNIYQWYLVISLNVIISLVVALILTSLSVARERELGTFEQLIVSPYSAREILVGKTLPPLCIAFVMLMIMTLIAVGWFGIPFQGKIWCFMLVAFVGLLSFIAVGIFISSICRNQQQAILGAFSFMMPAILLSGFVSPIADMPKVFQVIDYVNPIRYFLELALGVFLKGFGWAEIWPNLWPLLLIICGTLFFAALTFKRNLE